MNKLLTCLVVFLLEATVYTGAFAQNKHDNWIPELIANLSGVKSIDYEVSVHQNQSLQLRRWFDFGCSVR